ncbi:hypothetical protein ACFPRL_17455 [Pseudoclavibacter helvolus]
MSEETVLRTHVSEAREYLRLLEGFGGVRRAREALERGGLLGGPRLSAHGTA